MYLQFYLSIMYVYRAIRIIINELNLPMHMHQWVHRYTTHNVKWEFSRNLSSFETVSLWYITLGIFDSFTCLFSWNVYRMYGYKSLTWIYLCIFRFRFCVNCRYNVAINVYVANIVVNHCVFIYRAEPRNSIYVFLLCALCISLYM